MTPDRAKTLLRIALKRLLDEDVGPAIPEGYPRTIGERPLAFRLAHYMIVGGAEQDGLHVDCDYNRHGTTFKELPPKAEPDMPGDIPEELKPQRFFPDIVVHSRGNDDRNVLVCEIKRVGDRRNPNDDRNRLARLTDQEGSFRYRLGAFVQIDQTKIAIRVEYFVDGQSNSIKLIQRKAARIPA